MDLLDCFSTYLVVLFLFLLVFDSNLNSELRFHKISSYANGLQKLDRRLESPKPEGPQRAIEEYLVNTGENTEPIRVVGQGQRNNKNRMNTSVAGPIV